MKVVEHKTRRAPSLPRAAQQQTAKLQVCALDLHAGTKVQCVQALVQNALAVAHVLQYECQELLLVGVLYLSARQVAAIDVLAATLQHSKVSLLAGHDI